MIRRTFIPTTLATLLLAGSPFLAAPTLAQDDDLHEVRVHKITMDAGCEEDDCEHMQRRIFISEDGTTTELHGDDMKWVHGGGAHDMFFSESRGYLGVQFNDLTPELREHFGVPSGAGVLISKVVDDSPAARAGVRVGDILTRVDNNDIGSGRDLMKAVGKAGEGETVNLEIWRANRVQTLAATIEAREPQMQMRQLAFIGEEGMSGGLHKVIEIQCDDSNGDDCSVHHGNEFQFELHEHCGESEECNVMVQCEDDGCTCTVNDEAVDCPEGMGN